MDIALNTNATMDGVTISLNSYCNESESVSETAKTITCTFTATSSEDAVLTLTAPGSRWESIVLSNISLVGGNLAIAAVTKFTYNTTISLRAGQTILWAVNKNASFQVFDLMGNRVAQTTTKNIDLSALPSGLYLVQAKAGANKQMIRVKNP